MKIIIHSTCACLYALDALLYLFLLFFFTLRYSYTQYFPLFFFLSGFAHSLIYWIFVIFFFVICWAVFTFSHHSEVAQKYCNLFIAHLKFKIPRNFMVCLSSIYCPLYTKISGSLLAIAWWSHSTFRFVIMLHVYEKSDVLKVLQLRNTIDRKVSWTHARPFIYDFFFSSVKMCTHLLSVKCIRNRH